MFTIEHDFDATIITLVDEGDKTHPLQEDITIEAFEDCVVIRQIDQMTDAPVATMVDTVEHGEIDFQTYFVRYRWQSTVKSLRLAGIEPA